MKIEGKFNINCDGDDFILPDDAPRKIRGAFIYFPNDVDMRSFVEATNKLCTEVTMWTFDQKNAEIVLSVMKNS